MAGADGFKHISVTPGDDEDVVVLAGVRKSEADLPASDSSSDVRENVGSDETEESSSSVSADAKDAGQASASKVEKPKAQTASKKSDDFHETTLEDLQVAPMSTMQKVIIAVAVLTIVVAIVYYMLFMR